MNVVAPPGFLAGLDAMATRRETPCGPGATMVWRSWGSGPPAILLHGGAGSWMHWARNILPLAGDRTVWAPDLPGFGDSDVPEDVSDADSLAPHVLRGATQVTAGQPFDLVGFSFGALVAALIAAEAPPALRRMVLVSVNGMGLIGGGPPALKRLRGVTDPAERAAILRFNLARLMFHDPDAVDDVALASQQHGVSSERLKGRSLVMSDILFGLSSRWRCPVDAVWGRQDSAYRDQIDRLAAAASRLNLEDSLILDGAGHWIQYERADPFNELLRGWLAR